MQSNYSYDPTPSSPGARYWVGELIVCVRCGLRTPGQKLRIPTLSTFQDLRSLQEYLEGMEGTTLEHHDTAEF